MWFTETSWPPMLLLLVAAMVCGWMWTERRQRWWLAGVIGCVVLSAAVWAYERSIITPREQIEQHILDLAQAFQEHREEDVLSYISPRAEDIRAKAAWALFIVTRVENLRISAVHVELLAAGSRARLDFRANGTISVREYGNLGYRPTRWHMTWQQEGGQWRIIELQRIDPITGQPMGLSDPTR